MEDEDATECMDYVPMYYAVSSPRVLLSLLHWRWLWLWHWHSLNTLSTLARHPLDPAHTQITSFMRNVANYTDFADIVLIRRLISITYLIPLPADAVVTPITFVVPKRRADACRGFLR